ncbi:hypothetical protein [Chitinophaga vietnamensis]|uniref:hypothetical protein n=1 Tax=Chitinophaga vietnamensis TaxID=2593957 RepID=UPI0011781BB9|nr:hypothetical protein [Chitinophaga vietnamensis]
MEYREELKLLRQQVPVGMKHGLALLHRSGGDVSRARSLFEEEMVRVVMKKAGITADAARSYLAACNYDVVQAFAAIEESQFTMTERILRKTEDQEDAIGLVLDHLEKHLQLPRDHWLALDTLQHLDPVFYCLLSVRDWLDYTDWEGFDYAVYFFTNIIVEQIGKALNLPETAFAIMIARRRSEEIFEQYRNEGLEPSAISKLVSKDEEFNQCRNTFKEGRPQVIAQMYGMLRQHIHKFP